MRAKRPKLCIVSVAVFLCAASSSAVDWAHYRGDAARGGYTAESLSARLALKWVRRARYAPQRAWVGRSLARSRMKFDWAHSAVAADGLCFFGSSGDDKLYALDAVTGEEKWSSFTGGPIRLAPCTWQGRVFAGSDDGFLYCLSASNGKLLWKLRAGRNGEKVIGNGRMVSRWVVRGGPAVRDGIVYFGAGIWPMEGVYVYAVDAESGKVLWCNDSSGALEIDQPHMVCFARGGVASQGYLAVTQDHVLLTTGRSVPAVFDRRTGRFNHFHLSRYGGKTPWGTGGGDVTATDDAYFNSGMAFDMATGLRYHNVGARKWWIPFTRNGRTCHGEFLIGDRQIVCVTPDGFIRSEGKKLAAATLHHRTYGAGREADTARATPRLPSVEGRRPRNEKHHLERIDNAPYLRDIWTMTLDREPQSLIVAGQSIVAGAKGTVTTIDAETKKATWSIKVDGTVRSLAVSGGRLLASTDRGDIYCFGKPGVGDGRTIEPWPKASGYPTDSIWAKAAEEIVRKTGTTKGFCLDADCRDGALAYELVKRTDLRVVALAPNADAAESARRKLDAAAVYGVRVAVVEGSIVDLPDYFADLIVSSAAVEGSVGDLLTTEIARVQRPCGGAVCIGKLGQMQPRVRGELAGAGSWTHNLADAGNTMYSGDTIVKGPLGMLWYKDETQLIIDRHGKNPAPLVYKGLLLREGLDEIRCTDAYNGTLLWTLKLPGILAAYQEGTQVGAGQIGSTFCVADDVLYARKDDECLRFDVFTGRKLDLFTAPTFPNGKAGRWGYLACKDGVLYGALMNEKYVIKAQHGNGSERMQKPMNEHLTESSLLFALDAGTGKVKWTFAPKHSIRNNAIAVGDGLVYAIDREPAEMDTILRSVVTAWRRGKKPVPKHPAGVLLALDAQTGQEEWRDDRNIYGTTLAVSTEHDVLLMGYGRVGFARPSERGQGMRAYRASGGKLLWESKNSGTRPAIVGRTIYGFPFAWDLLTGEQRLIDDPKPGLAKGQAWRIQGKGQGCGLIAGSKHMLLLRSATLSYYDLTYDRGWLENYGGLRAGCFINAIPAGGIVVAPDDTRACRCSYQNQASIALKQHGFRPPDIDPQVGQTNYRFGRHAKEPVFTDSLVITVSHERDDVAIRYTLDDSQPTTESPRYTDPITLTDTTSVRAAAFKDGRKVAVRDAMVFTKVDKLSQARKQRPKARRQQ